MDVGEFRGEVRENSDRLHPKIVEDLANKATKRAHSNQKPLVISIVSVKYVPKTKFIATEREMRINSN